MPKIQANIPTSNEVQLGEELPVMEAFYTLQGEGQFSGQAAYFIRLAGCDVGCVWCDVKDSWDASEHPVISVEKIVAQAREHKGRLAVITGGEPLMYNLSNLTTQLQKEGFRTHIETSGAYPITGTWDWITFSPKKFKDPLPEFFRASNELKVIVYNSSDLKWCEELAASCSEGMQLLLQPEWGKRERMVPEIIAFVKENPRWKISLQTHKYMQIP